MLGDVRNWSVLVASVIVAFATVLHHTVSGRQQLAVWPAGHACAEILEPFETGIWTSSLALVHVILDTAATDMVCFESSNFWLSGSLLMYGFQLVVVILYLSM